MPRDPPIHPRFLLTSASKRESKVLRIIPRHRSAIPDSSLPLLPEDRISQPFNPQFDCESHQLAPLVKMGEEYDPDGFSLRISPGLFQVLSGRAADPGPIEPRTPREASLIEAVRKEARRERSAMYRELKEDQVRQAHQLEQTERLAVVNTAQKLDDKLSALNFPTNASSPIKPCASFREAITRCYKANGKDNPLACAGEVEAFSECAKQLTRIGH